MSNYSELLKDPRWQKKRLEILNRDEFTCQNCGTKTESLNVHHWRYGKNPWDISSDLLTTLCEVCHNEIKEKWEKLIYNIITFLTDVNSENRIICKINEIENWINNIGFRYYPFGDVEESKNIVMQLLEKIESKAHDQGWKDSNEFIKKPKNKKIKNG